MFKLLHEPPPFVQFGIPLSRLNFFILFHLLGPPTARSNGWPYKKDG